MFPSLPHISVHCALWPLRSIRRLAWPRTKIMFRFDFCLLFAMHLVNTIRVPLSKRITSDYLILRLKRFSITPRTVYFSICRTPCVVSHIARSSQIIAAVTQIAADIIACAQLVLSRDSTFAHGSASRASVIIRSMPRCHSQSNKIRRHDYYILSAYCSRHVTRKCSVGCGYLRYSIFLGNTSMRAHEIMTRWHILSKCLKIDWTSVGRTCVHESWRRKVDCADKAAMPCVGMLKAHLEWEASRKRYTPKQ